MSRMGWAAFLAGAAVVLIFGAGFFHASEKSPGAGTAPPAPTVLKESCEVTRPADTLRNAQGLLAITNSPAYKRAGDLSLRVADCTKAEDDLESRLTAIKGEILDMVMEGTEGSRTCTLSAVIPADQFRTFIVELRKMGKVQSERITASKLRPGAGGRETEGAVDPRELSLVSIRMADEKVAQTVLESRGVLASSFDRSASHFMKGLAVIVELVGMALPFLLGFLALAAPLLAVRRLRRARPASV